MDDSHRVTLTGNVQPFVRPPYDAGPVPSSFALQNLQLVLGRSPDVESALATTLDGLHDKTSPTYHQWLTSQQYGDSWGVAQADIDTLTQWLESFGMHATHVSSSRMQIDFTATAWQVARAFHTSIDFVDVDGQRHIANTADPEIPAAFSGLILGIVGLHDFKPHPTYVRPHAKLAEAIRRRGAGASPDFSLSAYGYYLVAPLDFATIYNVSPLWTEGNRGAGQTIAVIEDTDIKNSADVSTFRSAFGLSGYAGTFTTIHPYNCTDPGVNADEGEAALDAEWAGAVAPDATIELASCTSVYAALYYLIETTPPPIISVSYGACEPNLGSSGTAAYSALYKAAVAQGVSVYVSSGDEGAASCDADKSYATHGISVSGLASSPYDVAVGGTDFMDTYDHDKGGAAQSTYWLATNPSTYSTARSYIPEIPWNSSCASQLIYSNFGFTYAYGSGGFCNTTTASNDGYVTTASGSGGESIYNAQPTWQTGVVGLPAKSAAKRFIPDVSLFAANGAWGHAYIYCMSDGSEGGSTCDYTNVSDTFGNSAGGTSFAAPAFAGLQALINDQTGASQGNPNYTFYKLAAIEHGLRGSTKCNSSGGTTASPTLPSSTCIFNDVTAGDMVVPCTGTNGCWGAGSGSSLYGSLSSSSSGYAGAYAAGTGWDYATGLGSVNAYNLVHGF